MKKITLLLLIAISILSCKKEHTQTDDNNSKNYIVKYHVESTADGISIDYKTNQGYGSATVNTGKAWSMTFLSAPDSMVYLRATPCYDTNYRTMSVYIYLDNVLIKSKTDSGKHLMIELQDTIR